MPWEPGPQRVVRGGIIGAPFRGRQPQNKLIRLTTFKKTLQPSWRPVRLKVANGEIRGGGNHEATISMEFWEHERLKWLDLAQRSTVFGNFYLAHIVDWDMIMGYDFMVSNAI